MMLRILVDGNDRAKKHMPLWRHLKQYVITGHDCVYRPDPPVTWTIGI